ncbi:hypothetical protein [Variovorax sp. EBFNA2]|uniref:hypothetical protein n=1 Tax=Variovorax sp. EBFNA2 TaxID=3342097 RepID=UPI0029BFBAAD|nr:hypothetical protein [Variovorax boronicumulans]WPG35138.1 hypothetical protein RZE79_16735 [Variovorax boronicumulans]
MRVKFIKFGSNSAVGGFAPGDVATVSDELAKHLVDEAGVAKYDDGKAVATAAPEKKPSDGLTIPQLREALAALKIEIPEGTTLKADLAALLDGGAPQ